MGELTVVLALDAEPAAVDLTRDGLGDRCLDAAMAGMLASHGAQRAPDVTSLPLLSAATVRQKGHAVIGIRSGVEAALDREKVAVPWFGDRALAYAIRSS